MRVDDMDKYQVTERIKMIKKRIQLQQHTEPLNIQIVEEIINPPVDESGFVKKKYLSTLTKEYIEFLFEQKGADEQL